MSIHKIFTRLFFVFVVLFAENIFAQGQVSGDWQTDFNIHIRDENIGASGNQVNDNLKSSSDNWLNVRYRTGNFEMGLRFDMFNNSLTFTGTSERDGIGLGLWYLKATIEKLTITAGHFYDQLGSGVTFRSFENRGLGLDNALVGIRAEYQLLDNLSVKAFTGRQKNMSAFVNGEFEFLNVYNPVISGAGLDAFFSVKEKATFAPGVAFTNRVIDPNVTMTQIVQEINSYPLEDRFIPTYNAYVLSIYNTLSVGNWGFYTELAGKTDDNVRFPDGLIRQEKGYLAYGSISYSQKGLGIVVQAKKTHRFGFRTSPLETLNDGMINFLPPQTRQNSLRLLSRYNHNTQEIDELSYQLDVTYSPKRGLSFNANYTEARGEWKNKPNKLFYREFYLESTIKVPKKPWKLMLGVQAVDYNQFIFEQKGKYVHTLTPFSEFTWKFDRKKSLRIEAQYLMTKRNYRLFGQEDPNPEKDQDLADWVYGLVEFNIAPHWSFSISDTYNFGDKDHFYSANAYYTIKTTRFSLGYIKMNEGIICTGGVCRFQPAFSGVKLGFTTSF